MKLITIKKRELLDLCIVLIVAAILSIFSISIHTIGKLFNFFSAYTDLPLAEFLINISFLSLTGLLWITYVRWRKTAKRQAELENIISSISPDVLLVVDSDRTIIECNNSLKRMFGYEVNEVINHKTDFLYFDLRSNQSNQDGWHETYDMLERDDFHIGWATGKKKNDATIPLEIIVGNLSGRGGAVLLLRDITERKRAEEVLRESERRFRRFAFAVTDVIYRYDPRNNQYDFISPSFELQTGYSLEEIKSDPSGVTRRITHPDDAERVFKKVYDHIKKGPGAGPFCTEYRVIRKDGEVIWVSDRKDIEFTSDGKVRRINGVVRDITERKRMEEKLQESEKKYRTLVEAAQEGIGITDPDENITFANKAFADLLGYSKEELLGLNLTQISDEEQFARFREETKKRRQGKASRYDVRVYTKTGEPKHFSLSATPLFDEEARFSGCLGMFIDITDRKRAEEALRESEEKLRAQYRAIPVPTYTWQSVGEDFVLVDCNDAAVAITHGNAANFIGEKASKMYQHLPEIRDELSRCFAEKTLIKREMPYWFKSTNESKHLAVTYAFVPPDLVMVHTEDITERKLAEEKLKEYTRQIEEKNLELEAKNQELTATRAQLVQKEKLRALGQMASGVAHNFNNLLAIILGRAQLLQRKAKELETEKGLRSIERAALDASSAIKRIQDFARVRKDQEFKWVDIDEVIEDVIALTKTKWKDQAEANGITIRVKVQKDRRKLPPVVGDESELREVFTNVIFNAVEAMPRGGMIVIRTQTDRKSISVSFTDSGTGIPEEAKQKIFDPFFTTKGVKNMGLGLSVAYGIIQRHHGDIQIESKQGEDTTVIVRLPVSRILGKEKPKEKESEKPPVQREPASILVIEDEKDVRELLFDILTSANYMVKLASGGVEGLEICKREKFDVVFTDLGMPRMSGWEVGKAIKEMDSDTTVLLITGWGVEMDEEKLKESGIDGVVTKPVKVDALLTLVSKIMESKKRAKEPVEGFWGTKA